MGIINRDRPDGGQHTGTTVVAAGSKLVGDLTLSDNLHVDGSVEGTVRSEAEVAIGEKGRVEGDLFAARIVISGAFEGNIDAQRLEIVPGGRVNGDVTVAELIIEPGAQFNGNSRTREAESAKAAAARDRKPAEEAKRDDKKAVRSDASAAEAG